MSESYATEEYREKLDQDLAEKQQEMGLLLCSVLVASIGLNLNSTTAIIGAKLLSPLMTPVMGMGFGLAIFDKPLVNKSVRMLSKQILVSILISSLYFWISPLKHVTSEILSQTRPTIWNILISIAGGVGGLYGSRKKGQNHIMPAVAIATSLVPPLCVVGYSLVHGNGQYLLGSFQLFLINIMFIMLAHFGGSVLLMKQSFLVVMKKQGLKVQVLFLTLILLLGIPAFYSGLDLIRHNVKQEAVRQFVEQEFPTEMVIKHNYNEEQDTLYLIVFGDPLTEAEIAAKESQLQAYGLSTLKLKVQQVINCSD